MSVVSKERDEIAVGKRPPQRFLRAECAILVGYYGERLPVVERLHPADQKLYAGLFVVVRSPRHSPFAIGQPVGREVVDGVMLNDADRFPLLPFTSPAEGM